MADVAMLDRTSDFIMVASSPNYSAAFFAKLRDVTGGSPSWEPPAT